MEVRPRDRKMQKVLDNQVALKREYGDKAMRIMRLITDLRAANSLDDINRAQKYDLHRLSGQYAGKWGLKVNANNRMLIFSTDNEAETNLRAITSVTIFEICIDYH